MTSARSVWQARSVGELSWREPHSVRRKTALAVVVLFISAAACTPTVADTVDLGDHPEPVDLALDEDFFHCEVQPKVLTAQGCAAGGAGESGSCHLARSALRLVEVTEVSICQAGRVVGQPSRESLLNLERVRTAIGVDADASPLYRRPLRLDSHPRAVFAADSEPATVLRDWLNRREQR